MNSIFPGPLNPPEILSEISEDLRWAPFGRLTNPVGSQKVIDLGPAPGACSRGEAMTNGHAVALTTSLAQEAIVTRGGRHIFLIPCLVSHAFVFCNRRTALP